MQKVKHPLVFNDPVGDYQEVISAVAFLLKGERQGTQDTQEAEEPVSPSYYPDRIDPGS
jgi:hypothetical protein